VELPTPPFGGSWAVPPMRRLIFGPYRVSAVKEQASEGRERR
jgi:hypothetical protein